MSEGRGVQRGAGGAYRGRGRGRGGTVRTAHDFNDDAFERHDRGDAYYWQMDRYPWEVEKPAEKENPPKRGRGRPRLAKNRPTEPHLIEFEPLKHIVCKACLKYLGTQFLIPCGHGLLCLCCGTKAVDQSTCVACETYVRGMVTLNVHEP